MLRWSFGYYQQMAKCANSPSNMSPQEVEDFARGHYEDFTTGTLKEFLSRTDVEAKFYIKYKASVPHCNLHIEAGEGTSIVSKPQHSPR